MKIYFIFLLFKAAFYVFCNDDVRYFSDAVQFLYLSRSDHSDGDNEIEFLMLESLNCSLGRISKIKDFYGQLFATS